MLTAEHLLRVLRMKYAIAYVTDQEPENIESGLRRPQTQTVRAFDIML